MLAVLHEVSHSRVSETVVHNAFDLGVLALALEDATIGHSGGGLEWHASLGDDKDREVGHGWEPDENQSIFEEN